MSSVTPATVEECVKYMRETGKKSIIPTLDADLVTASTVNLKLWFPAPSLLSIIACNNKNLASVLIGKCVAGFTGLIWTNQSSKFLRMSRATRVCSRQLC